MFMTIIVTVIVVPVMFITFFVNIIKLAVESSNEKEKNVPTGSWAEVNDEEEEGLEQYGEFFDEHYTWP